MFIPEVEAVGAGRTRTMPESVRELVMARRSS
jgi:hypothetical protein